VAQQLAEKAADEMKRLSRSKSHRNIIALAKSSQKKPQNNSLTDDLGINQTPPPP